MKVLRTFCLLVSLCCGLSCFSANMSVDKIQTNRIDSLTLIVQQLQGQIREISKYNDHLCKLVDNEQEANSNAISNIANLIDVGNRVLNGWGVVLSCLTLFITIGGIVLGRYISKRWKEVSEIENNLQATEKKFRESYAKYTATTKEIKKMLNEAEKTNDDTKTISQEANKLNEQIQHDIQSLYLRLRDEETKTILQRLIDSPEDVSNAAMTLYSRVLDKSFFKDLKSAYQNLLTRDKTNIQRYEETYQSLFYQHFTTEAMEDPDLVKMFIEGLPASISYAFLNDVVKSTKDYMLAMEYYSDTDKITYISQYVLALKNTRFSIPDSIFDDLLSKLSSDIIHKIWEIVSKEGKVELTMQISNYLIDMYERKDKLSIPEMDFVKKYKAYIEKSMPVKDK